MWAVLLWLALIAALIIVAWFVCGVAAFLLMASAEPTSLASLADIIGGDEWTPCYRLLAVTLITGKKSRGDLMRRYIDGKWQYRRPTADEEVRRLLAEKKTSRPHNQFTKRFREASQVGPGR